jgi:hypothetical protein
MKKEKSFWEKGLHPITGIREEDRQQRLSRLLKQQTEKDQNKVKNYLER